MLDTNTQLAIASAFSTEDSTPLTFITGLKYNTNLVKTLNNITFLYDPNWEYEKGNPTYPLAFFHVKSMTESMDSDISQKPMLFYNASSENGSTSVQGGLLNIVSDNIIIKPKTYKLDVIIPMNASTMFNGNSFNLDSITYSESFIFSKEHGLAGSGSSTLSTVSRWINVSLGILKTLIKALYGTEVSASSIVTMLCQQQDYNKASIEYMWRNRRILKLKMWTGWNFKYLMIKNFDVTKNGENGDYFEGTITCQEIPILTVQKTSNVKALKGLNVASAWLGKQMKNATNIFIKAMEATAGD